LLEEKPWLDGAGVACEAVCLLQLGFAAGKECFTYLINNRLEQLTKSS